MQEREDLETQTKARKIEEGQRRARKADLKKKKVYTSLLSEPELSEPDTVSKYSVCVLLNTICVANLLLICC